MFGTSTSDMGSPRSSLDVPVSPMPERFHTEVLPTTNTAAGGRSMLGLSRTRARRGCVQEHGTKCCNVAIANGNPNHLSMIALRVQQEVRRNPAQRVARLTREARAVFRRPPSGRGRTYLYQCSRDSWAGMRLRRSLDSVVNRGLTSWPEGGVQALRRGAENERLRGELHLQRTEKSEIFRHGSLVARAVRENRTVSPVRCVLCCPLRHTLACPRKP